MLSPSSCCVCPTLGFSGSAWVRSPVGCCDTTVTAINIDSDTSHLTGCDVVFTGFPTSLSLDLFASGSWSAVKTWIDGGGRLYLALKGGLSGTQRTNVNNFLSTIGSAIVAGNDALVTYNDANAIGDGCMDLEAGDAQIGQGLDVPPQVIEFCSLTGGASVFKIAAYDANNSFASVGQKTVVAVEALSSGFVFVAGFPGGDAECYFDSDGCNFFKRLWGFDDTEII